MDTKKDDVERKIMKRSQREQYMFEADHEEEVMQKLADGLSLEQLDHVTKSADGLTDYEVGCELEYDGFDGLDGVDEVAGSSHGSFWSGVKGTFSKKDDFKADGAEKNAIVDEKVNEAEFKVGDMRVTLPEAIYVRLVKAVQELGKEGLEVGGLLKIDVLDGELQVLDFELLPQEVGGADFVIKGDVMAKWMLDHADDKDIEKWRAWWHSHHSMGLFWSGTDDEQFEELVSGKGRFKDAFGIVFVNSGNFRARYDVRTPFGIFSVDNMVVDIERGEAIDGDAVSEEMKEVVEKNVTKRSFFEPLWGSGSWDDEVYLEDIRDSSGINKEFSPLTISELVVLAKKRARTGVWKEWSLENECLIWGVDYGKLCRVLEKRKMKKNKKKGDADEGLV